MAVVPPDMDWDMPVAASLAETTRTRGLHDILCTSAKPLLRQLVPSLPWREGPTDNSALISYAAAASVMWAAFKLDDNSAACTATLLYSLLKPSTMARALNKLQALKFDFSDPCELSLAQTRLQAFVARHDDAAFMLSDTDLESVDPGAENLLRVDTRWIRDIELGQWVTQGFSTKPLCLLEIFTAPRETIANRYDPDLPCVRTFTQVERSIRQSDAVVKSMVESRAPADDIREKLAEVLPELFVNLTCPPSLLETSMALLDRKCLKRSKTVTALLKWSFSASDRNDMIIHQIMKVVKAFPSLSKVVLPCASAVECYELIGILRNSLTPTLQLPDTATMKSIDSILTDKGYVSLIDTDERRDKTGAEKTPLVLAQLLMCPSPGTSSASTLHSSNSSGSQTPGM